MTGAFLTDQVGNSLYMNLKDISKNSTCYGECAILFTPALTNDRMRSPRGVDRSKVGSFLRKDGKKQLSYNGHPLYLYSKDSTPYQIKGHGLNNNWFLVNLKGSAIRMGVPASPLDDNMSAG